MGKINLVREAELPQTEIIHKLSSTSATETGDEWADVTNPGVAVQSKVYGILIPIITINSLAVGMNDLDYMKLDHTDYTPKLEVGFWDRGQLFKMLADTGSDNELRLQILPPQEDTYKKIDLTFSIVKSHQNSQGYWWCICEYKVNTFTSMNYEALGQKTTYELCDYISLKTGLGLASNVEATEDSRFMECRYCSYEKLLDNEIKKSKSDAVHVYDAWVDLYNDIVLCDVYDRISNKDAEEDMMVWVTMNGDDAAADAEVEMEEIPATISNMFVMQGSDLQAYEMNPQSTPPVYGNAKVISVFNETTKDWEDCYVGNGDFERDQNFEFEYAGEIYGDYNYLYAEQCRNVFLDKIMSEYIEVKLKLPMLGLIRGDQVRLIRYDNQTIDEYDRDNLTEMGLYDEETIFAEHPELQWLKDYTNPRGGDFSPMKLDLIHSGQYTIIGQVFEWSVEERWNIMLKCVRPLSDKPKILPVIDPETNEPIESQ